MASLNRVQLIGNVGRDPEVRYMQNGDPIMNFSLATTEKWKGRDGQQQEKTEWHRIEVFGALAKSLQQYITKGKQLFVEGKLVTDEWTDKDGNKRQTAKVKLSGFGSNIILLGGGRSGDQAERRAPSAPVSSDEDVPF